MPAACSISPNQVIVNLYGQTICEGVCVKIWKVQRAPRADIRVGQIIWFESEIFFGGKEVAYRPMGGSKGPVSRYEGEVQGIIAWQKYWVKFNVGVKGREMFQLWVPIDWTALGFVLRTRHMLQRHQLMDNIPLPPAITGTLLQTRMTTTSRGERIHMEREVAEVLARGGAEGENHSGGGKE